MIQNQLQQLVVQKYSDAIKLQNAKKCCYDTKMGLELAEKLLQCLPVISCPDCILTSKQIVASNSVIISR